MGSQSIHRKINAFSLETGSVVIDKGRRKDRNDAIITEGLLNHSFRDMYGSDVSKFSTLHDDKVDKSFALEGSGHELFSDLRDHQRKCSDETLRRVLPEKITGTFLAGKVKMPEGKGLIKVPGSFTFLPDFLFSLGFSTLVSLFVPFKTGHDLRVALRTVLLSGAGSNCIGSSHETELPHILRHARSVQLAASEGLILAVRQGTSSPSVKVLVSPHKATLSVLCLRTPKETP